MLQLRAPLHRALPAAQVRELRQQPQRAAEPVKLRQLRKWIGLLQPSTKALKARMSNSSVWEQLAVSR